MCSETLLIQESLQKHGFVIGARDRNLNTAFSGKYMVAESYPPGTISRDGSDGPWCVVGDHLETLIETAGAAWPELLDGDGTEGRS